MNLICAWLLWLVAPTILTVVLAVVLSFLPIKIPDTRRHSWFKGNDW